MRNYDRDRSTIMSTLTLSLVFLTLLSPLLAAAVKPTEKSGLLDSVTLGSPTSEQSHHMVADLSETITGGLGIAARRLLPETPPTVDGGRLTLTMKVDPQKLNYVTAKFWGSDDGQQTGRLYLFVGNKQIGWRHLGEVDPLNITGDLPIYPGRFFYTTVPLPLSLTQGKITLPLTIRSTGSIFVYGADYSQYQHTLESPTRGIYGVYTHTEPYFIPPAIEKQGTAPTNPPIRVTPGEETLTALKENVNARLLKLLSAGPGEDTMQMLVLAKAYNISWTSVYHSDAVIQKIIALADDLVRHNRRDPHYVYNVPKWQSFGPAGYAIFLLAPQLQKALDQPMPMDEKDETRRAAWSEMLQASLNDRRIHRRMYSNQAMISDMNLYTSNMGLEAIDPANALPEAKVRRYLYEAVGLQPWLGSDTPTGPSYEMGDHYTVVSTKGLTKELGFVGHYGEVTDWVARIYDITRRNGDDGDPKLKAQLLKMIKDRSYFRYPSLDQDGDRAMMMANLVGWRDVDLPRSVAYGSPSDWESSAIHAAALLRDPMLVGYAQQMLADNQFFRDIVPLFPLDIDVITYNLLTVPDDYATIESQPASPYRLPMTPGQPDFAWADEEDGVLALKHGTDILYASLYWRARFAINSLARVNYITPTIMRLATIREEPEFTPSGLTYTIPDWPDFAYFHGGFGVPGDVHNAFAGEVQPIAQIPAGVEYTSGEENAYAGKASFYRCRYSHYLIGMNCTTDKTYTLAVPGSSVSVRDLVSQKKLLLKDGKITVPPMSTVVVYLTPIRFNYGEKNLPASSDLCNGMPFEYQCIRSTSN